MSQDFTNGDESHDFAAETSSKMESMLNDPSKEEASGFWQSEET